MQSAVRDIVAKRDQPFDYSIGFPGVDLTAVAMSFEVRANKADDATLLAVNSAGAGLVRTLSVVEGEPYTTVAISFAKATMQALPSASPIGDDLVAWHGLKVAGVEYLEGRFVIVEQANHG